MLGERIGHFQITARVGRGGMGEVFVAEHDAIKTRVAIKVLHDEVSTNTRQVQRFFNEAHAVARIQHAGIVKIFDVGFHNSQRAYLIMEFLEGETLAEHIDQIGKLPAQTTAELARQIASVLGATHHAGIIHRDLKPENVFLVSDREHASGVRVKLLDFGIAKLTDAVVGTNPTTAGTMGTPTYMAPEQWSDSSRVDWRADAYSLGCLIYKMATGRPPFPSTSIAEACAKHLHETPQSMRVHVPDVPPALDELVLRLLAKDPAKRAPSIDALQRQLAELTGVPPPPAPPRSPIDDVTPSAAISRPAMPAVRDAGPPGPMVATTLSSAVSIHVPPEALVAPAAPPPRRRLIRGLGAAVIGAAAIAAVVIVARGRGDEPPPAVEPAFVSSPAPVDAAIDAGPRAPSLADWLEVANPFVEWHGAQWLAHQVTRREYRRFLESMPPDHMLQLIPMTGWNDGEPMRPVAWVTFERARAFCAAIHARLPASDEWLAASGGEWGLDPSGSGRFGPLQEWTATERDGLVIVRGGHEKMSPAARRSAALEPLMKSSEAAAGPAPVANVVAAETLGFRCIR
ncbi:MAG TPA: bifunctional serine/threonine-protein kinase/formylglycine-generating enzyme family protein [Kofleriaceae bacterium]